MSTPPRSPLLFASARRRPAPSALNLKPALTKRVSRNFVKHAAPLPLDARAVYCAPSREAAPVLRGSDDVRPHAEHFAYTTSLSRRVSTSDFTAALPTPPLPRRGSAPETLGRGMPDVAHAGRALPDVAVVTTPEVVDAEEEVQELIVPSPAPRDVPVSVAESAVASPAPTPAAQSLGGASLLAARAISTRPKKARAFTLTPVPYQLGFSPSAPNFSPRALLFNKLAGAPPRSPVVPRPLTPLSSNGTPGWLADVEAYLAASPPIWPTRSPVRSAKGRRALTPRRGNAATPTSACSVYSVGSVYSAASAYSRASGTSLMSMLSPRSARSPLASPALQASRSPHSFRKAMLSYRLGNAGLATPASPLARRMPSPVLSEEAADEEPAFDPLETRGAPAAPAAPIPARPASPSMPRSKLAHMRQASVSSVASSASAKSSVASRNNSVSGASAASSRTSVSSQGSDAPPVPKAKRQTLSERFAAKFARLAPSRRSSDASASSSEDEAVAAIPPAHGTPTTAVPAARFVRRHVPAPLTFAFSALADAERVPLSASPMTPALTPSPPGCGSAASSFERVALASLPQRPPPAALGAQRRLLMGVERMRAGAVPV
ncbi:hypothetical protein FA09DRAFT_336047 [Tilletiopsis washingtonensis]|uniref:Uncharacterized protein n=1 Tax=Tilletiopsis washingtonensis TaxID=58919 RepID=A0A316ZIT5_9BASI|nr:hypothetical protein FA09DRAFT_336047 [Tilletiopsis washingtonensis]PWO01442.1 hypothetical protein FA09DRAFT_336047 [Tilletiopsis washingtonensis]